MKTINHFQAMYNQQQKIAMATCYDYPSAQIIEQSAIDCVLVGDSVGMIVHGLPDTTKTTLDMIKLHTAAVARGTSKFIVADLPFMSYRKSLNATCDAVTDLIQAGGHAVKLEGATGNLNTIQHIVESGIPVMGHIGLTPQFVHKFGGYKVQGRDEKLAAQLIQDAQDLQNAGCFAIVLECVPWQLGQTITNKISIPTIGIGAGPHTSGQILVWHDVLGLQNNLSPKFAKIYLKGAEHLQDALSAYAQEVKSGEFPHIEQHSYA